MRTTRHMMLSGVMILCCRITSYNVCYTKLLRPPSSGRIFLETDGARVDLVGRSPQAIVDLGIALVPEGRRLFPTLSVEENLMLGAYRQGARAKLAGNLEFMFEVFPVLAERRKLV